MSSTERAEYTELRVSTKTREILHIPHSRGITDTIQMKFSIDAYINSCVTSLTRALILLAPVMRISGGVTLQLHLTEE